LKYFERRKKAKLYQQWVEQAGLPPDATGSEVEKSENTHLPIDNPEAAMPIPDNFPAIHAREANQVAIHPDVTGDMMAEIKEATAPASTLYSTWGCRDNSSCGFCSSRHVILLIITLDYFV